MIPITENTIKAVAALIYNHAYDQDPDTGWLAEDEHSAPGDAYAWLEWSACLIQVIKDLGDTEDEQVLALASKRVDIGKAGHAWNTLWMHQTEDGDAWSTMTSETDIVMPLVRDFLEHPEKYVEVDFIEDDPAYLAYLEAPLEVEQEVTRYPDNALRVPAVASQKPCEECQREATKEAPNLEYSLAGFTGVLCRACLSKVTQEINEALKGS